MRELHKEYRAVDLFETQDLILARSLINHSMIKAPEGTELPALLGAIEIWDKDAGFCIDSIFSEWNQAIYKEANFAMSMLPLSGDFYQLINSMQKLLEEKGLPTFFFGSSWHEVGCNISKFIECSVENRRNYLFRSEREATCFNINTVKFNSEYDFQNYINLLLVPLIYDTMHEQSIIKINGQDKIPDFMLCGGRVIIEAKHIRDTQTKSQIESTLEGLGGFYTENPRVQCLVFLVLVNDNMAFDFTVFEKRYASYQNNIIIKCIKNEL